MKTERPPFDTSNNPVIAELNALVYETFKPKWSKRGWIYRRIYYLGDNELPYGWTWILGGITPIAYDYVLEILKAEGKDVSKFEMFFDEEKRKGDEQWKRDDALRSSAKTKLTEAERNACGLA